MIRLLSYQVHNWGYAPFMNPLPVGALTLCFGENGSGKTTYLTGIGLLLGVPRLPKEKSYEQYVREGENWDFLKAVVHNGADERGKRPFDALIPDSHLHDTCTLALMIVNKAGEWRRSYYIVPGDTFAPSPTSHSIPTSYLFPFEKYRSALEQLGVRAATMRLLELGVTGLHDMHEPRRLFDFFVDLIGSEATRVEYTRARREWRKAQDALEHTHARFLRQDEEVKAIGTAIESQRTYRSLLNDQHHYQQFLAHAHVRDLKTAYMDKTKTHQRLVLQKAQLDRDLSAHSLRQAGLQGEYNEFVLDLRAWKNQRSRAEETWHKTGKLLALAQERVRVSENELLGLRLPPLYDVVAVGQALHDVEERESEQRFSLLRLQEQWMQLNSNKKS